MTDLQNVSPEIDHYRKKGSQMKHDIEENRRVLHSEKGLKKDQVPGAADGQKLRDALNDS